MLSANHHCSKAGAAAPVRVQGRHGEEQEQPPPPPPCGDTQMCQVMMAIKGIAQHQHAQPKKRSG